MKSLPPHNQANDLELRDFEARIRRHQGALFAYLSRLGLPPTACEDVAQEACLRAWRHRRRFDAAKGAYATWLFRIARNLAYSHRRRLLRSIEQVDSDRVQEAESLHRATDMLERGQLSERIDRTLKQLSAEDRETLALACVEELSSNQAAAVVECSPGTFRVRLSRARRRFITLWEQTPS